MEQRMSLLLAIWREVGRHIAIAEAIQRFGPLLRDHLPMALLLVRRLENERGLVETIASWTERDVLPLPTRNPYDGDQLVRWLRNGAMQHDQWQRTCTSLPGLLPDGAHYDVLAAPLGEDGVVVLAAHSEVSFDTKHETLFMALHEPLSAAYANDHRLREINTLREVAEADKRSLLTRLGREDIEDVIIGGGTGLREVMECVGLVSRSDTPVLILGETGSGKEVVARAIHKRSPRVDGPFLRVNCGAIPAELVDSELFGHERGSFTGAVSQRKGWFERADGGTLFLDEVGELSLAAQVRLLRILQDGTFQRVGGQQQLKVDVRVVAATHRDLREMVQQTQFRADLWYRVAVFPIYLPALRERVADIPALANHFALRAARRLGLTPHLPDKPALSLLAAYPWPGNVRELASVMERAAILGNGNSLAVATALGVEPARPKSGLPLASGNDERLLTIDAAMARHIENALQHCQGRIEGQFGVAQLLGINPHTLRARMRKLNIDWGRFRTYSVRGEK